jgi:hypothetical protein
MGTRIPILSGEGWSLYVEMLDDDKLHLELNGDESAFEVHKNGKYFYVDITIPEEVVKLFNLDVIKAIRKVRDDSIVNLL